MRRLAQLDALRGIAAAAVVLYHYTGMRPGADGVFLFFVISGFVILVSIETKADFTSFAWARFVHLYPVYWASMALTIVAMLLWGEAGTLNPARLLANISMVPVLPRQFLAHTRTADWFRLADIDDSYWTLIYELVFYLLAGVTCLVARIRRPEWPCLVWIAASALVRLAPSLASHGVSCR